MDFGDTVEGRDLDPSAAGENSQESTGFGAFLYAPLRCGAFVADMDQNGQVGLDEVYRYSYRQTLRSSGRLLQLQHPTRVWYSGQGTVPLTWPLVPNIDGAVTHQTRRSVLGHRG